jgi:zinc finger protein
MSIIKDQPCPFCSKNKCTLSEDQADIPYFGKVFILAMNCDACGTRKSDIEPVERKEACKYTLEVESDEDLNIKIVKGAEANIKIPRIITIESGPASNGYITTVEGILERVKKIISSNAEGEDNPAKRKKAKNLLKKISKILVGREKVKIIIEDKSGHSAIISDKATKTKL